MRRLLPAACFEPIFGPLAGKKIGLVDGVGNNVGDQLIYAATRQLLDHFQLSWRRVEPGEADGIDFLLLFGGGNLGSQYREEIRRRQTALATGLPAVILPQSAYSYEPVGLATVYLREPSGRQFYPEAHLAPDLALGYQFTASRPSKPGGLFLRQDLEGRYLDARDQNRSLGDPIRLAQTPEDYIRVAGQFEYVITDRLHFAIAAMINAVPTVLLENRTPKNRGMWETWLRDLGCQWATCPDEAISILG
ncbi:Polysaccharide pyruvyl transferase [Bremerella volcania]|uniref:Polysaccharide pyruvyl transferase n=2 Tax=Bremerella volcania TaxID=2527984 RepID=A0A518C8Z2_9BACT|nr:Polysaccharide pyruvyl transferase [Bremerella volcania]